MPRTLPLHALVQVLDLQDRLDSQTLAQVLASAVGAEELATFARFQGDRYQRVSLHRTEDYEIRLLCWLPGQSSALHEHGPSACAFRILLGTATESRLDGPDQLHHAGDVAQDGGRLVHQVANLGQTPLVTLHIYSPPLPVDQPSSAHGKRVAIVGGGLSGVALAVQLLETQESDLRITLIAGAPDEVEDENHLMETPAERLSLDPSRTDDFAEFAGCAGHALAPRYLYQRYAMDRLRRAIARSPGRIRLARDEVVDLQPLADGWRVSLASGRTLVVDHAVLATEAPGPRVPEGLRALEGDPRLVRDPLVPGALDQVLLFERVLVVGTGLNALDTLVSLRARGHLGPVAAVSRSGRWPRNHLPRVIWRGERPDLHPSSAPRTADGLAAWLRGHVDAAGSRGIPWQAVIDELEPHVPEICAKLSVSDRARLLSTHGRTWETLRRRAPVDSLELLRLWKDEGWLRCMAGAVSVREDDGQLVATVDGTELPVDRILLCTGGELDVRRSRHPLWTHLLARGLVTSDPSGLTPTARNLWVVGPLRGPFAPPLVAQARDLALTLVTVGLPFPRLVHGPHIDTWS